MLHNFEFRAPTKRSELLALLAGQGSEAKLLAGGTDLLVNVRAGASRPAMIIDVKRVEGYAAMSWSDADGLVIRPATTINDVLRDAGIRRRYPLLVSCAHDLASHQIRNRATVIGNIVNASPCSDMAPALLCLDASAVIASAKGERRVPVREFFLGVKRTVLAPDEVLDRVEVPASSVGARGAYAKHKRINGHDLGIIGVAVHKQGGALRVAISSAAPTPVLVDGLQESAPADAVAAAVSKAISPISDLRCTKEYRAHMVDVFVRRLLQEVK